MPLSDSALVEGGKPRSIIFPQVGSMMALLSCDEGLNVAVAWLIGACAEVAKTSPVISLRQRL